MGTGEARVRLGVSLSDLTADEVPLLAAAMSQERPYLVVPSDSSSSYIKVVLSVRAEPRQVYEAYIHAVEGEDRPEVVTKLEEAGWQLDTLALETVGYRYDLA